MPNLDVKQAIDFLKWWGNDPSVLTAIPVTKKKTTTNSFSEPDQVQGWIEAHEHDNVYFTVNPLLRAMSTKPSRSDIKELAWLHVDIDPRPGEEFEAEQVRALQMLTTKLPPGVPPPSCIVFSGGGYQGFWRLNDPFKINGQEAKYEEAKRWNIQLEILFNGDNCHNVDRIMRLPGTINWPTAKKQSKGRVVVEAKIVEMNDLAYDLKAFTPAPEVKGGTQGFTANTVKVSGNVQKLASVDDLGEKVSDKCKVVIVQGHDPDDPGKWPSRSECLFWVCCELVRAGVDDDTIFSVLMDSDFRISDSILDKDSNAGKYAVRQIERAREDAIDPWLRELNEKHAVVMVGGQVRVIRKKVEKIGEVMRSRIDYLSFGDFANFYCNQKVQMPVGTSGKFSEIPVGKWWLVHEQRRTYDNVVFSPAQDIPGAYNLWEGFSFEARPGDCQMILDHLGEIICSGDTEAYNYIMGWMATAVQQPAQPGHSAIVMRGRQGTGKNTFAYAFGALFGRHYLYIRDSNHLFGQFNGHLQDCLVLFADEAFWAGNKKHEGLLKSLITEDTHMSEKKGKDAVLGQNFVKLLMASNEDWIVPANHDDRRFLVLDVDTSRMEDTVYFGKLKDSLKLGGYEALLHRLMTHDLSSFNIRRVPKTEALREQKVRSFAPEVEWWYQKLVEGRVFPDDSGWDRTPFKSRAIYDYTNHAKLWGHGMRSTATKLGMFMRMVVPKNHEVSGRVNGTHNVMQTDGTMCTVERPNVFQLPSLEVCRAYFDEHFGGPFKWTEPRMVDKDNTEEESF